MQREQNERQARSNSGGSDLYSNRGLNKKSIESIHQWQLHHSPSSAQESSIKRSQSELMTLELPQGEQMEYRGFEKVNHPKKIKKELSMNRWMKEEMV